MQQSGGCLQLPPVLDGVAQCASPVAYRCHTQTQLLSRSGTDTAACLELHAAPSSGCQLHTNLRRHTNMANNLSIHNWRVSTTLCWHAHTHTHTCHQVNLLRTQPCSVPCLLFVAPSHVGQQLTGLGWLSSETPQTHLRVAVHYPNHQPQPLVTHQEHD
jgi:hypothetical protein